MKEIKKQNISTNSVLKSILFCLSFTGLFIILSFSKSFVPVKYERIAYGVIGTIASLITTYLFLKFDQKSFADIGLKFEQATLKRFFSGAFMGMALMGLLTLSVILFSHFKVEINNNSTILNFLFWTIPLIPLAFMEEVGFRAYPMIILKDAVGIRNSIIITSLLFALYHIVNGWTMQNAFLGAGVWGIIYGLAAIYSNGISMPTGMHYAANLTTSAFGVSNTSFNIWILKQQNGLTLENHESGHLVIIIPQIGILLLGIIFMECYLRKKNHR